MRRYRVAVEAAATRRMFPPHRQSGVQTLEELGIHLVKLYNWRRVWRLQVSVVSASEKESERWSAADRFIVLLATAGPNASELSAYCRDRGHFAEQP
jgi:transposase